MTERPLPATPEAGPRTPHRPLLVGVGVLGVVLAGVVGLLVARSNPQLDERWMTAAIALRGQPWDALALGLNLLGGHVVGVLVVPVLVSLALYLRRGRWPAAFFLTASIASALVVRVLKLTFDRVRPEDMLVASDQGSFPSGHTANAATIAVALGVILRKLWVWIAGALYAVLMALSRTYLGAHWLTDTVGGLLVGTGAAVLCWAGFSLRLAMLPKPPPGRGGPAKPIGGGSAEPGHQPGGAGQ